MRIEEIKPQTLPLGTFVGIVSALLLLAVATLAFLWNSTWTRGIKSTSNADWTQHISIDESSISTYKSNSRICPTPLGNWANTCLKDIEIIGPCAGKCWVQAKCQNLKLKIVHTTFDFLENTVETNIKNVNGLLCRLNDDGSPSCGVNFHGNLISNACAGSTPARRQEKLSRGLDPSLVTENETPQTKQEFEDGEEDVEKRPTNRAKTPREEEIEEGHHYSWRNRENINEEENDAEQPVRRNRMHSSFHERPSRYRFRKVEPALDERGELTMVRRPIHSFEGNEKMEEDEGYKSRRAHWHEPVEPGDHYRMRSGHRIHY